MRPVIEIMFPDFSLVAADQLFNKMGELRHMFNGRISFPVVLRTRFAVGTWFGGHHSMDPVGIFGLFASWRSMGLASRLSDEIQERFFDYLDCPIRKLTLPDVPPPVSRPVEKAIIPGVMEIKAKMIQGSRHHF